MTRKRVMVNGACGRMGQEVVKTVIESGEELVAACDRNFIGEDIVKLLGMEGPEVKINADMASAIQDSTPDVIIDFTSPITVMDNIEIGLSRGVNMIVGTTGITEVDLKKIHELTIENNVNALIVPNFAIGAVLMMRFAAEAARFLDQVEIIELHHDQKIDAPSGTALKTAELIAAERNTTVDKPKVDEIEKLTGARGGESNGIHIHSVRLPGLVAHQEVIFGTEGQSLTLRHDSYNRKSFMPGVRLALRKIDEIDGLVYGLEKIME